MPSALCPLELLRLLGVPTLAAPSEGEAQAAHMAATSSGVWAAASKDYDALLFGAPRLVRFLTILGNEFLPSRGTFRPIVPETLELARLLEAWRIDRAALVDLALLVGTDFNKGIKGIGPKKALKLVQDYGRIEQMLVKFLCDEREFSRERVSAALDRAFGHSRSQGSPGSPDSQGSPGSRGLFDLPG